jgi:hypothetical protein
MKVLLKAAYVFKTIGCCLALYTMQHKPLLKNHIYSIIFAPATIGWCAV